MPFLTYNAMYNVINTDDGEGEGLDGLESILGVIITEGLLKPLRPINLLWTKEKNRRQKEQKISQGMFDFSSSDQLTLDKSKNRKAKN